MPLHGSCVRREDFILNFSVFGIAVCNLQRPWIVIDHEYTIGLLCGLFYQAT